MLKPKNINTKPRGGWSVTIENGGPEIRADHYKVFLQEVSERLRMIGQDHHGWKDEIVDLMCKQRPDIACQDTEADTRPITSDDVVRFMRTLWEATRSNAKPVSVEEQDRRAGICTSCPQRGRVSCMGWCGAIARMLSDLIIGASSKRNAALSKQSCMVCGCELSSMVKYPLEVLHAVDAKINYKAGEYPEHCWKRVSPEG